ncbi:MAG: nucleotide sugar dehydrogenase [Bacteroidetes bacterium]|nr:nucleotide sugar dehydrogenase [Bacteroidota bacterium]
MLQQKNIAVIGLGYVGLPLAIEFAKHFRVYGFDINQHRVNELKKGIDKTHEADVAALKQVVTSNKKIKKGLSFTSILKDISSSNIFIVTVPTPVDQYHSPNLGPLLAASAMIGKVLKKNDVVIYESTVYPGCTEDDCVPVLEKNSGLKFNKDFYAGYSPERINPGDKINTLTKIKKVTSGSTPAIAAEIDELYKTIIKAGTHQASSIKVAEASKAIENAQRDVNISFVNELALIFDKIGIDTNDVLDAAGTKWNFLKFKPGLVGGHCISVDPYYLAHKAVSLGYHPQVILSGRHVNDYMGQFVAGKVVKMMIDKGHKIKDSNVLIMGIAFKENCPDIRNSRVIDIYQELIQFGIQVDVFDPRANASEVKNEFDIDLIASVNPKKKYAAIIVAVCHKEFLSFDFKKYKKNQAVIFDAKACLDRDIADARL